MKKILIIYHKEDNDGVFSGAICKNYLINKLHKLPEDIEYQGHTYDTLNKLWNDKDLFNSLKDDYYQVMMVDISFDDYKAMIALKNMFGTNFYWVDHHLPIIKMSLKHKFDDIPGERDHHYSALLLTWFYLYDAFKKYYNDGEAPKLLRILSGWDSWSYDREGFTLEYVKQVNMAVTNYFNLDFDKVYQFVSRLLNVWHSNSFTNYSEWEKHYIDKFEEDGRLISDYNKNQWKLIVDNYGDKSWKIKLPDGTQRTMCALFVQGATTSQMFDSCKNECQNGIVFKHNIDSTWSFSLYNTNIDDHSFHCGEFLKRIYYGGGHEGAAGATLSEIKFIKILKSKTL